MTISLVVPVFNEEETIDIFYKAVREHPQLSEFTFEIVFINDGSIDGTELLIRRIIDSDDSVVLINLSRNFGKEPAMFAGLDHATGEAIIPIDVDLQDPLDTIPKMIREWQNGADVVLARRIDRSSDSFLKRISAKIFYRLHNKVAHEKIPENVGDFRLMTRRVVESIKALPENQLFMKGVFNWVGYKTATVDYVRDERIAGTTKFNIWKLLNLALDGITSFSTAPLRIWTYIGILTASLAFIYAFATVLDKLINGNPTAGFTTIVCLIILLGGLQMIGIGILGEYLGRIYQEAKQRPRYICKDIIRGSKDRTRQ
jgi:polyisoprenyl-phosphate glycosyltransferase